MQPPNIRNKLTSASELDLYRWLETYQPDPDSVHYDFVPFATREHKDYSLKESYYTSDDANSVLARRYKTDKYDEEEKVYDLYNFCYFKGFYPENVQQVPTPAQVLRHLIEELHMDAESLLKFLTEHEGQAWQDQLSNGDTSIPANILAKQEIQRLADLEVEFRNCLYELQDTGLQDDDNMAEQAYVTKRIVELTDRQKELRIVLNP